MKLKLLASFFLMSSAALFAQSPIEQGQAQLITGISRVFNIPSNWDFYAGVNAGFYFWNSPEDYDGSHTSGLGLGAQIGGRYYFSDNVGINLELGGGNAFSGGKFGLSFKF